MVPYYKFKAMVPGTLVEHPCSTDLSRTKQSKVSKVIGSVEQGDWDAQPMLANSEALVGKRNSDEVNQKALA